MPVVVVGLRCGGRAAVRGAGAARNESGQAVLGHQMLACHINRGPKLSGPHTSWKSEAWDWWGLKDFS